MKEEKKKAIMNCTTFEELLDEEYGPKQYSDTSQLVPWSESSFRSAMDSR